MKKMIAILLALVMVCSLFGCTKQNTDAPVAGTDSTAEKKLSFGFVSKTTAVWGLRGTDLLNQCVTVLEHK